MDSFDTLKRQKDSMLLRESGLRMTADDAKAIACGLLADGLDVTKLSRAGRVELRRAIDRLLYLAPIEPETCVPPNLEARLITEELAERARRS